MAALEKFSGMVLRGTERYFEFERPATPGEQTAFRAFELFVVVGLCWFAWKYAIAILGGEEGVAFQRWLATHIGSVLDGRAVILINAAAITVLLALGWFRRGERYVYLAALPLLHLQFVARYWPGRGLHHSQLVGMCLLAIGLAFLLFDAKALRLRFALGMTYVFVGLCYALAALSKLGASGLDWPDGSNMQLWILRIQVDRIAKGRPFELNFVQELVMSYQWLGTLILLPGLLIELSGLLMCVRRVRMYYATAVIMIHLGVIVTLKIYFPWNISLLLLLGYPWPVLIDWVSRRAAPDARVAGSGSVAS